MKLPPHKMRAGAAGILLIECVTYIAVFSILLGLGTGIFFFCWDHTRLVISQSNNIEAALWAGEHWRTDVRAATGKISVATTPAGQEVTIPERGKNVIYRFAAGELRRQVSPQNVAWVVLPKVKASTMQPDPRGNVSAWRWEVELAGNRKDSHFPLLFTFEAVAPNTP